jgi:hypothetical protein
LIFLRQSLFPQESISSGIDMLVGVYLTAGVVQIRLALFILAGAFDFGKRV